MGLNNYDSPFGILIYREVGEETNPDIIKGLKKAIELYEESGYYSLDDLLDEEDERNELEKEIAEIAESLQWRFSSKGNKFIFSKERFSFSITAEIDVSKDEIAEEIRDKTFNPENEKHKKEILELCDALEL